MTTCLCPHLGALRWQPVWLMSRSILIGAPHTGAVRPATLMCSSRVPLLLGVIRYLWDRKFCSLGPAFMIITLERLDGIFYQACLDITSKCIFFNDMYVCLRCIVQTKRLISSVSRRQHSLRLVLRCWLLDVVSTLLDSFEPLARRPFQSHRLLLDSKHLLLGQLTEKTIRRLLCCGCLLLHPDQLVNTRMVAADVITVQEHRREEEQRHADGVYENHHVCDHLVELVTIRVAINAVVVAVEVLAVVEAVAGEDSKHLAHPWISMILSGWGMEGEQRTVRQSIGYMSEILLRAGWVSMLPLELLIKQCNHPAQGRTERRCGTWRCPWPS